MELLVTGIKHIILIFVGLGAIGYIGYVIYTILYFLCTIILEIITHCYWICEDYLERKEYDRY